MKKHVKTIALVTTGLVAGVVVARFEHKKSNKGKILDLTDVRSKIKDLENKIYLLSYEIERLK
ncbi:hypothetical protein [Globicatella sanguinis]